MKNLLIVLCFAICFASAFGLEAEKAQYARSWSYADPALLLVFGLCVWRLALGTWRFDWTSIFLAANVVVLGLSGLLNGKTSNGTLLNYVRTGLGGWLMYTTMFNVVRSPRHLRRFCWFSLGLAALIYYVSIPNLSTSWSGEFTNQLFTFGTVDLNSYGFIFVLLFCAAAPLFLRWMDVLRTFAVGGILASGALVSFSRSAWTNLLIAVAIIQLFRESRFSRGRSFRVLTLLLALGGAGLVATRLSQALPGVAEFGETKIDTYGDDVVNTRLYFLTFLPIRDWLDEPAHWLFGDGESFQHTFLANALVFSGVFGLACGLGIYGSMLREGWKAWKRAGEGEPRLISACYIATTVVMFLDDSITNHRYHSQIISYLFFCLAGALAGAVTRLPVSVVHGRRMIVHETALRPAALRSA